MRKWRKGNPYALLVEMQFGAANMENSMGVPKKINIEPSHDPAIQLLNIYTKTKILI